MSIPPPGIPLSPDQQKVAAHLAKIAIWLGRVTMVLGILLLALVALMAVTAIPRIGLRGEVVILLGVVASVAFLFMWQATAVGDAGQAFRELGESPFPGLVALAIGKTARYFSVDALMFWGCVAVLVLTCTFAVVGS